MKLAIRKTKLKTNATSKKTKKTAVRKKAHVKKTKAFKSPRKIETREPAPSLFLNLESNPAHRPGHRRINLKENRAISKAAKGAPR